MGRIEKTVFISYRRTNYWTALAVYQNLHTNGYDVFFDYKSIPSGDFEQVITENIISRAHFVVILSPSSLERCKDPGDWLRREIETAIEYKRNIIPLAMEGFDFGSPATTTALTGKLVNLKNYNGLGIPAEYFDEAMAKLRSDRFLNRSLDTISHPASSNTIRITEEQKIAANESLPIAKEKLTAQEWFERGYIFQNDKNFDEAIRCYSEAIKLDHNFFEAYGNRGNAYKDKGDSENAFGDYQKVLEIHPNDDTAYFNLGNLLDSLKRYDEAEAIYRKAIHLKPDYANAYSNLGLLLHEKLKRYDEAEAAYRKAIQLYEVSPSGGNSDDTIAYYNLGNLLSDKKLKRYDEAEAAYRKAIQLDPNYDSAYSNLGLLLHENLKRYDEAEAVYRKAIELNPNYATAYYNLGLLLHEKLKRYSEAEANFRKAIELNPSFRSAYYNLACLKSITGNIEGSFEHLKIATQLDGFDSVWAWEDPDLQWIRNDPRFVQIVGPKPE